MKTFFMKVFLMISAMACMFQGMMLLSVGLGRLSPQKLVILYEQLFSFPAALKTIELVGTFFIILGFILLIFAARTKEVPKIITIEQDGQSLNVTYKTVIDFIEQVGSQDPYVTHFLADFINNPKEGIIIPIEIELNGVPSVQNVLNEMEYTLRTEIENVFGLKKFRFDFHVRGVSIDPKKKYFTSHAPEKAQPTVITEVPVSIKEPFTPPLEKVTVSHLNKTPLNAPSDEALEKSFMEKRSDEELEQLLETTQKGSKKTSLVSRMLWGK